MAQDTVANFNSVFFKSCGSVNSTGGSLKNTHAKLGEKRGSKMIFKIKYCSKLFFFLTGKGGIGIFKWTKVKKGVRAFTSTRLKDSVYFTSKTYFFYFTLSFL